MTTIPAAGAPPLKDMSGPEMASLIASRLCHDFISPGSAIASGLDLLDDPDMRDVAMEMIVSSTRKLVDVLQFSRVAFGGGEESYSREALDALAQGVFAHHRGDLELSFAPDALGKVPARAFLNLCAVAAAALPRGGTVRLSVTQDEEQVAIEAVCEGLRAGLRPELTAGLHGEGPGEGLAGHWIQAAWTQLLIEQAGGTLQTTAEEGRVVLKAAIAA